MSVESHRAAASNVPVSVRILVVSTTRTTKSDTAGARIAELLAAAGHEVLSREVVDDDIAAIQLAVGSALADGQARAIVLTGGTGIAPRDVTPEAVRPLFNREMPGFGELFRMLSLQAVGPSAVLSRATAGTIGAAVVYALPGSQAACELALEKLILPELAHTVHLLSAAAAPAPVPSPAASPAASGPIHSAPPAPAEDPSAPQPSGRLGRLGQGSVSLLAGQDPIAAPPVDASGEVPPGGWKRAVWEIRGEIADGKWEDLPEAIENLAPVVDVLHKAGERKVMTLPNGRKYSLFGYPDLQRPSSKVIAIGWGQPLAEVVALHRWPVMTGMCIDGTRGVLPPRSADVGATCEAITGRPPRDTSGELYALQGDAVWVQRDRRVVRWDGRKEFDDGTPNQVLASLVLHWSQR